MFEVCSSHLTAVFISQMCIFYYSLPKGDRQNRQAMSVSAQVCRLFHKPGVISEWNEAVRGSAFMPRSEVVTVNMWKK